MSTPRAGAKSVFVGNIPYDATEEQLKELFSAVGPVVSFRLVTDPDTGKPKGFGFCEYRDSETAQSAMRNLNNTDFAGRPLRVDYAANDKMTVATGGPGQRNDYDSNKSTGGRDVDGVVPGQVSGPMQKGMSPAEMYDTVAKMKVWINEAPDAARQFLLTKPQVALALLHAQIVIGMVTPAVVQKIITYATPQLNAAGLQHGASTLQPNDPNTNTGGVVGGGGVPQQLPPQQWGGGAPMQGQFPNQMGGPMGMPNRGGGPVPVGGGGGGVGGGVGGGGGGIRPGGPPIIPPNPMNNPMSNPMSAIMGGGGMDVQQTQALLQQVLNLPPQQFYTVLEKLPADQRPQAMAWYTNRGAAM